MVHGMYDKCTIVQDSSSPAVSSDETKQKLKGHWGCQVSLSSSVNSVLACWNIKRYIGLTDSDARDFFQTLYPFMDITSTWGTPASFHNPTSLFFINDPNIRCYIILVIDNVNK
jgi:hypothetical protein